jgi:hypothetical protein
MSDNVACGDNRAGAMSWASIQNDDAGRFAIKRAAHHARFRLEETFCDAS